MACSRMEEGKNKAFRITDVSREVRLGVTASSLSQLVGRGRAKLDLQPDSPLRICLEEDGTEIDEDDYFATLEPHTCLMLLQHDERWTPYKSNFILGLAVESEGGPSSGPGSPVEELIWRLHQDLSFFPWLTLKELETISKMDREEMAGVVPDPNFLEFLQTLCERYLQEKDKMEHLEHPSNGGYKNNSAPSVSTSSILSDPLKLIRLYSKFNSMKAANGSGFFSFSSCGSEESLASLSLHQPILNERGGPSTPHKLCGGVKLNE